MFRQNSESINNCILVPEEAHYGTVLLLQQYGLGLVTCAIYNFNILRLLVLIMKVVRATSTRSTAGLTILSFYLTPLGWHLGAEICRTCCLI